MRLYSWNTRGVRAWSSAVADSSSSVYILLIYLLPRDRVFDRPILVNRSVRIRHWRLKFRIVESKTHESLELGGDLSRSDTRVCTYRIRAIWVNRRKSSQITESFPRTCFSWSRLMVVQGTVRTAYKIVLSRVSFQCLTLQLPVQVKETTCFS